MNQAFIVTKEHRRFTEFANAVRKEKTIGICHGAAGVGKTNSARRYANWDALEPYINEWGPRGDHDAKHYALANRSRTVFYTPEVLCRPKDLKRDIDHWQIKVGNLRRRAPSLPHARAGSGQAERRHPPRRTPHHRRSRTTHPHRPRAAPRSASHMVDAWVNPDPSIRPA